MSCFRRAKMIRKWCFGYIWYPSPFVLASPFCVGSSTSWYPFYIVPKILPFRYVLLHHWYSMYWLIFARILGFWCFFNILKTYPNWYFLKILLLQLLLHHYIIIFLSVLKSIWWYLCNTSMCHHMVTWVLISNLYYQRLANYCACSFPSVWWCYNILYQILLGRTLLALALDAVFCRFHVGAVDDQYPGTLSSTVYVVRASQYFLPIVHIQRWLFIPGLNPSHSRS
jgi:hypothetical protein